MYNIHYHKIILQTGSAQRKHFVRLVKRGDNQEYYIEQSLNYNYRPSTIYWGAAVQNLKMAEINYVDICKNYMKASSIFIFNKRYS